MGVPKIFNHRPTDWWLVQPILKVVPQLIPMIPLLLLAYSKTCTKKKFWGPQSQRKARFGDPKWQQFLQSSSLVKNSSKCFWASSDLRLKAFSNDPCNASGVSAKLVEAGGELPKQWLPGYPLLIKHRAEKSSGYPVTSGIFQTYSIWSPLNTDDFLNTRFFSTGCQDCQVACPSVDTHLRIWNHPALRKKIEPIQHQDIGLCVSNCWVGSGHRVDLWLFAQKMSKTYHRKNSENMSWRCSYQKSWPRSF